MKNVILISMILTVCGSVPHTVRSQQVSPQQALYETGTYLSIVGKYEAAVRCYDAVLSQHPRADIFHNAGLNQAIWAAEVLSAQGSRYYFPFEAKLTFKGRKGTPQFTKNLLRKAASYLQRAIELDPDYRMAYIDYASVLFLIGAYNDAELVAQKVATLPARSYAEEQVASYALAIRAVIAHTQQAHDSATLLAAKAAQSSDSDVLLFLAHNDLGAYPPQYRGTSTPYLGLELIDGLTATRFAQNRINTSNYTLLTLPNNNPGIRLYTLPNSLVYAYLHKWDAAYFLFTKPIYKSPSRANVHIGDPQEDLQGKYGKPQTVRRNGQGELWYYDQSGVIFQLGTQGAVQGWITHYSN